MGESGPQFIDISRLQIGMFVHLDLGWMDHPFPLNSFKLSSQEQLDVIRSLGIDRVRISVDKSDSEFFDQGGKVATPGLHLVESHPNPEENARQKRRNLLAKQHASLQVCEKQFSVAAKSFKQITESAFSQPELARELSARVIGGFIDGILVEEDTAIRLLSEKAGEKSSLHALNVTIISLLLGKTCGLNREELTELGEGALLHDIGKMHLPDRLRWHDQHFLAVEREMYQEHVAHGVDMGRKMGLAKGILLIIGQHHECVDGSGYPGRIRDDRLMSASRIVALVNQYDNLCNPGNSALSVTPHEALSLMFANMKQKFHAATMSSFIRMMGVYPPGSVVQLSNDRHALVVSVNSSRPLRPRIIIHDPRVPSEEALVLDLETEPTIGIRSSLKPMQLPKAAYDYLSPRKRMCYFFERACESGDSQ
ncbi:MAG: DUF3391 domain-containing protein [Sulfuricellaceae bacterium]|nr:DUF3391 domain-containing protein [Sulfuricellaceae bacterium]